MHVRNLQITVRAAYRTGYRSIARLDLLVKICMS